MPSSAGIFKKKKTPHNAKLLVTFISNIALILARCNIQVRERNVTKRCLSARSCRHVRLRITCNVEQPPTHCCFLIAVLPRGNIKSVGTISEKLGWFRYFLGKYEFLKVSSTRRGGNEPARYRTRTPRVKSNVQGRVIIAGDPFSSLLITRFRHSASIPIKKRESSSLAEVSAGPTLAVGPQPRECGEREKERAHN